MNIQEAEIVPYHVSSIPLARVVVVFAPHPDDEVFGCGGSLALHAKAGHAVRVILLTAGDRKTDGVSDLEYANLRLNESAAAASVLGIATPECWEIADRAVGYGETLVERIMGAIVAAEADVVYAPSLWESHPDHRATAMSAIEAVRRLGGSRSLLLYELSAPLRPNRLVDISSVWVDKAKAMACFDSQNKNLDYPDFIGSLNRYRALTLGASVNRAEAFEAYSAESLNQPALMPFESEHRRLLVRGVSGTPNDCPMVSVIVRTKLRPTLRGALDSIVSQTYSNIELVLVDVVGDGLTQVDLSGISFPVRIASTAQSLSRASAANLGLQTATGEFCLFLDDDDWLFSDHLAKLVRCAGLNTSVKAVHTAVTCVDTLGNPTGVVFDFPYSPGELKYGNFMPIHGVLFRRSLVALGCNFDSQFDLYEDWDFWMQVEAHTAFAFVPGVSAAYRIDAASGSGVQVDPEKARGATAALFLKWETFQSETVFSELVTRSLARRHLSSQVAHLQQQFQRVTAEYDATAKFALERLTRAQAEASLQQERAATAERLADEARQDAHHFREAHDRACSDRDLARGASIFSREEAQRSREEALRFRDEALRLHGEAVRASDETKRVYQEFLLLTGDLEKSRIEIQQRDAELHHRNVLAQQEMDHVRQLQARAIQAQAELDKMRAQMDALHMVDVARQRDLETQKNVVAELMASTSWQITQPIRQLGTVVLRVRRAKAALVSSGAWQLGLAYMVRRLFLTLQREGVAGVRGRVSRLLNPAATLAASEGGGTASPKDERTYAEWLATFEPFDAAQLTALRQMMIELPKQPLISIVMPVYNSVPAHLASAIESVQSQLYTNWELCICDDASTDPRVKDVLIGFANKDSRIRLNFQTTNGHISRASNVAIHMARGQYIAFLDHDDELSRHALLRVAQSIVVETGAQVFYSDEDKIDESGQRFDPYFKPDFNLGLLRSHNYMCHFAVYEADFLRQLGGLREGFEGAQDYDLALRAVDSIGSEHVVHLPYVLYHWRAASGSTAAGHGEKSYAFAAGQRALTDHLARRQLDGVVEEAPEASGMYRMCWAPPKTFPLVSIVIPTRNGEAILRQCLNSLRTTTYPNFETIVVDNGSDDPATLALLTERSAAGHIKVLRDEQPFNFSALNNHAVNSLAKGEFVLLLNNDIEAISPAWLDEMVGAAMEAGVGCVGARLWYPDWRLQHGVSSSCAE
ncbi:MAG: glycosyltransferase [Burkholderiales bacterium]|nr:glycosyltransferase [Burkholderiales bacterium]